MKHIEERSGSTSWCPLVVNWVFSKARAHPFLPSPLLRSLSQPQEILHQIGKWQCYPDNWSFIIGGT